MNEYDQRHAFNRRQAIAGLTGVALATAAEPNAATAVPSTLDVKDPIAVFGAYRKLRFANHGDPVYWWMRATKYGIVDGDLKDLYDMEIASIFRVIKSSENSFTVRSLEFVYSVDASTGALLEELENPYTGDMLPIRHVPVGPTTFDYTPSGPHTNFDLPGSKIDSRYSQEVITEGDQIWMRDDIHAVVTATDSKRKPFLVNDLATYNARIEDVLNPEMVSAPCSVAFQAVSSWQIRMQMGDRKGSMLSRGAGAKVDTFDELPARFRELMSQVHPEIFADPIKALDGKPFRFER